MGMTGDARFVARLRRATRVGSAMDRWANESAEIIAQEARDLLDEGGFPDPNHIVSLPGQPANSNTRNLAEHTQAEDLPEIGHAAVISDAEYSIPIEFGRENAAERPFMRPATANKRKFVLTLARNAVNKAIR